MLWILGGRQRPFCERRHTVVGNEEETGLGWQSPLERAV